MERYLGIVCFILIVSCAPAGAPKAYISDYSGDVKVNGRAVAAKNLPVVFGDVIETGKDSSCRMIVNEKNIFAVKSGTRLVFRVSEKENELQLDRGWLACVARKMFSKTGLFLVRTPTLVASIRGTSFCGKVEAQERTYFCVCNGRIELKQDAVSPGELVVAAHHAARRYTRKKDGSLDIDRNPGLLYHDDKGVSDLAGAIHETIDWSKPYQSAAGRISEPRRLR